MYIFIIIDVSSLAVVIVLYIIYDCVSFTLHTSSHLPSYYAPAIMRML